MKQVSTNHPSLRGVSCYDCGDDTAQHGWLDEADSAFFCERCHYKRIDQLLADEQYVPYRERKEAVLRRRFPDYNQRVSKARRRNLLASLALLTIASLTDNFWYVLIASGLVLLTGLPYMMRQREE